jgi:hypothetical protein
MSWQRAARGPAARVGLALFLAVGVASAAAAQTSGPFGGAKVNRGTVTLQNQNGQRTLTLSPDFEKPGTPDPHWQVVDSKGVVYPLQRLDIKGDKFNGTVTLPAYVPDVAKVQIWCAFAETLLGEASFAKPVR